MRLGIVYLGRRGAGGPITEQIASNLQEHVEVFSVLSASLETLSNWEENINDYFFTETFSNWFQALITLVFPRSIKKLAQKIASKKPDILIYTMSHPWLYKLQKYLKTPAIFLVHDATPHPGLFDKLKDIFDIWLINQMQACIVLSPQMKSELTKRNFPEKKIYILPLGSYGNYHQFSKESIFPRTAPKLLFFGRIEKYKGLEVLIDAFDLVLKQINNVELLIVGAGDISPYNAAIQRNKDNITVVNEWIGEDDIGKYFFDADVLILPYTSASQSGVIPIAASFKMPVIATQTGGLESQIFNGETGYLVEPGNSIELAKKILELILDQRQMEQLGEALYIDYKENRSWCQFSNEVIQICKSVVTSTRIDE